MPKQPVHNVFKVNYKDETKMYFQQASKASIKEKYT